MTIKHCRVIFSIWDNDYDLSAYSDKYDFLDDVWFDIWRDTDENDKAANCAEYLAKLFWDANS